jgi:proline racemase
MQTFQVIDTHTAGHPTRAIQGGLPPLKGASVRERRDHFKTHFDHLRPRLLHEPRGHAAMVGVILTDSSQANFGAFFISSYVYLDMCGHATIGLARTLAATGQIDVERGPAFFSLETPAGIVRVDVDKAANGAVSASIRNVPAYVEIPALTVDVDGVGPVELAVSYCGGRFALVDTAQRNWVIEPDHANELCRIGAAIKDAVNREVEEPVGSVLFFSDEGRGRARHLVVLESNKFDRSPCGTGTSARLAALHASGALDVGEPFIAESIVKTTYRCHIEETVSDGGRPGIRPRIAGEAYLSAFSTLVVEASDPLADGFLCR